MNYKWTILKFPEGMSEYDGKVIKEVDPNCSFVLEATMLADEAGEWQIELEVRDILGDTQTDTVRIMVVS